MTARTAVRVAWFLWGLAMALEAAGILLWLANHAILVDRSAPRRMPSPMSSWSPVTPPSAR